MEICINIKKMGWNLTDLPQHVQRQVRQKRKGNTDKDLFTGDCQTLFIGELPPMLNGESGLMRMHWTEYQKVRERWKWLILREKPERHAGRVSIRFTRISTSVADPDNVASGFKAVGDGLVDAGVIEDDSFEVIKDFDVRWQKASSRTEQGVRIEIINVN